MRSETYKANDRENKRILRMERKSKGLCTRCGKEKDDPTKTICFDCREYQKDRRAKLLLLGICPLCGKERIYGNEKWCMECAEKHREHDRIKRETNHDELNRLKSMYRKRITKTRIEQGICTRCGKKKATEGYKTCALCRYKVTEKARERRARSDR